MIGRGCAVASVRAGNVIGVSARQSSGDAALDAAVVAQMSRKGSVAAPPDGQGTTLTLPITLR